MSAYAASQSISRAPPGLVLGESDGRTGGSTGSTAPGGFKVGDWGGLFAADAGFSAAMAEWSSALSSAIIFSWFSINRAVARACLCMSSIVARVPNDLPAPRTFATTSFSSFSDSS